MLDIRFYVGGKFRYSFALGRTGVDGVCRTSFEEIERQLEASRQVFLMDYNTPLTECDAVVGIAAPTAAELAEREAARKKWWPEEPSPRDGGRTSGCDAGSNRSNYSLEAAMLSTKSVKWMRKLKPASWEWPLSTHSGRPLRDFSR